MRTALIQFNPTVGDLDANTARMVEMLAEARAQGAELAVFPELAVCGYPPRDLLLHEGFVAACVKAAKRLGEEHSAGLTLVFGCPLPVDRENAPHDPGRGIANSLLAYRDGEMVDSYDKRLLPTYDVFDERRYFVPGDRAVVLDVPTSLGLRRVGLSICEDLWKGEDAGFASRYLRAPDPVAALVEAGADTIVSPSASPFVLGKGRRHRDILIAHAARHRVNIAAVNQVGGNDDLVFDGHAAAYDARGHPLGFGPGFEDAITIVDIPLPMRDQINHADRPIDPVLTEADEELLFRALVLGTRDYLRKTAHRRVLLGLSGGIDSAVTCAIAVAALGPDNVLGVAMPGKYSSDHALADANDLADRLGVRCVTVPIAPPFEGLRETIDPALRTLDEHPLGAELPDLAEQNLQSRARGAILMAISNRTGALLLTTGNKSELAVGYCTLYGDMNGGLSVLSDVPKLWVYRLARWMNAHHADAGLATPPIPASTIEKPPSAELAPDQRDDDSLPPYDVLDPIVERYVEGKQAAPTIVAETGFARDLVARITRLIDINEYKRKQTPVGIKVTAVAFGSGRRVPIAQRWRSG
ncbi:MAG: NAD+ synthase [Planctomycetota bacterium]|nr:NAD+ synthase [Planctomycetota bacterium]